ncbi:MAG: hypothetical protein J6O41_08010, partial [Clostridia bacterium]|nr:hypothetical protein [Clostridia bacterium]
MKPWKTHQIFFLFFVFLLCFKYSTQIDCSGCQNIDGLSCTAASGSDCDSVNCKPKYSNPIINACYDCSNFPNYYSISSDPSACSSCSGDKIIEKTKECTSDALSDFYKLGDFYYLEDPSQNNNAIRCSGKICNCAKYFYEETIETKTKLKCYNTLDAAAADGYFYYDYNTNKLFQSGCPDTSPNQKKSTSTGITRCSADCYGTEWYKDITSGSDVGKYCLDDCGGGTYKYRHIDEGVRKCLDDCPTETYKKGVDCVTLDQCDFYLSTTCYTTCPSGNPYHKYGSKECISDCPTNDDYKYKKNPDDNTCYRKEDCLFVEETDSSKTCLSSCTGKFHDYDSKLCVSGCGSGGSSKLYFASDGYVCYDSCSEIPGREYIYEEADAAGATNKKCYKPGTISSCDIYYKKPNGIRKCSTILECIQNFNSKYLLNGECKDNCDGYYQVATKTTDASPKDYFKCYENLNDALTDTTITIKFCDTSKKKCWTTFPTDGTYYIKDSFPSTDDKYELVRECENFYYKITDSTNSDNNHFKCVSNCKGKNLYFFKGNKNCEAKCNAFYKYYFDDSNNECLDSCESLTDKPFSDPPQEEDSTIVPEKCREACDSNSRGQYHNFNSHICRSNCQADNNIYLYYKNSDVSDTSNSNICYPSCLDIPGGTYKYELTDNSCSDTPVTSCEFYYKKGNGILKCASYQICKDLGYFYIIDK